MRPDRPSRHTASACLLTLLLVLAVAAGAPVAAQETVGEAAELTLDLLFDRHALGAEPEALTWSPDGEALAFVFDDGGGRGLWVLAWDDDGGAGEAREVLGELAAGAAETGAASEAGAEDDRDDEEETTAGLPRLVSFSWSPDGSTLLVSAHGDLWTVPAAGGDARRLTATEEAESGVAWSPDGSRIAFVRDYDLWVMPAAGGEARALTTDGRENEILNGVTDWVYWEELWGRHSTGFWWSPDGSKIAYYRFDEEPVGTYPLVDFTAVPYPKVTQQKYPKAGTDNPRVKIGVMEVARGEESTVWMDTAGDEESYLARAHWRPLLDGETEPKLAVHRLSREQTDLDLVLCDAASGDCSLLVREHWDTWVNLEDDFAFLADGRFVWGSARSGWRHLYLHAADGTLIRPLTAGDWAVTSLDAVDEERGRVVFTSFPPGPLGAKDRRVAAVSLSDEEPGIAVLTEGDGWHGAVVAANGRWVHTWSDADTPPTHTVRDADGTEIATLPHRAPDFDPAALPAYRFFQLDGPDGETLPAMTLAPAAGGEMAARGGDTPHPGLMYHYGGPGSQVVVDAWGRRTLWQKMMAQRGYAVLSVDNGASTFFGKRGEDRQHRRFGPINLAAQQAGAAWLAAQPGVDGSRLGLWGWSGGGTNTLYCLFNSPGTWAAGMSGAPVTDWRLYDTIWTERYLDHPDDNPEGYRLSSPITHVDGLADHLLVVHGTADDNVHPQNTLALAAKLVAAEKPFEDAVYPRQKHGFRGKSQEHFYRRMTEFFDRTLAAGAPAGGADD